MVTIRVVYLGPAADWAGVSQERVSVDSGSSLGELVAGLMGSHEALSLRGASLRYAVNEEFAQLETVLSDGDEVAVIPPVSGGQGDEGAGAAGDFIELTGDALDVAGLRNRLGCKGLSGDFEVGGVVIFEGITRYELDDERGGLLALDYEAYGEMAVKELRRLAVDVRERWGAMSVVMAHRVGRVGCGEASVFIGVACGHRAEAFEACRYLIDTLKKDVPIWKREIWSDGESSWVDPTGGEIA